LVFSPPASGFFGFTQAHHLYIFTPPSVVGFFVVPLGYSVVPQRSPKFRCNQVDSFFGTVVCLFSVPLPARTFWSPAPLSLFFRGFLGSTPLSSLLQIFACRSTTESSTPFAVPCCFFSPPAWSVLSSPGLPNFAPRPPVPSEGRVLYARPFQ